MNKPQSFQIHKTVKKKEMVFEYILLSILVLLLVYLIIFAFNLWPQLTSKTNLTTVAGFVVSLYALVWQLHSSIKAKRVIVSLGLTATVKGNDVIVSASITNAGTKSIYPLLTNLYISEGIEKQDGEIKKYIFEPVTEHNINILNGKGECFDCNVASQCKKEALETLNGNPFNHVCFPALEPESPFANTVRYACNLKLLSYYSLIHIMPNESFSEEAIFTIRKAGYYRVFMIYTDKEWKDCICKSIVIRIENPGG